MSVTFCVFINRISRIVHTPRALDFGTVPFDRRVVERKSNDVLLLQGVLQNADKPTLVGVLDSFVESTKTLQITIKLTVTFFFVSVEYPRRNGSANG